MCSKNFKMDSKKLNESEITTQSKMIFKMDFPKFWIKLMDKTFYERIVYSGTCHLRPPSGSCNFGR